MEVQVEVGQWGSSRVMFIYMNSCVSAKIFIYKNFYLVVVLVHPCCCNKIPESKYPIKRKVLFISHFLRLKDSD
jgi:hypothetical protein